VSDQEVFDPARIAARQAQADAYFASLPPAAPDPDSPEAVAVAATLAANDMSPRFDGTYCGRMKVGPIRDVVPNAGCS
jgi:hypothetical protein